MVIIIVYYTYTIWNDVALITVYSQKFGRTLLVIIKLKIGDHYIISS